jgi:hypothetical protein
VNKKDFSDLPDLEPILYMQKMLKNKEKMGSKGDKLITIEDIGIYKVDFKLDDGFITAGYMMSVPEPTGEDFLDLTPMNSLKEQAEELVKAGKLDNIDKMWLAYTLCSKNTELIKYTKLSQEEVRKLMGIKD